MSIKTHKVSVVAQLADQRKRRRLAEDLLTQRLRRSVRVEQKMLDAANGKRPMPTQQELREWALELGTPDVIKREHTIAKEAKNG